MNPHTAYLMGIEQVLRGHDTGDWLEGLIDGCLGDAVPARACAPSGLSPAVSSKAASPYRKEEDNGNEA